MDKCKVVGVAAGTGLAMAFLAFAIWIILPAGIVGSGLAWETSQTLSHLVLTIIGSGLIVAVLGAVIAAFLRPQKNGWRRTPIILVGVIAVLFAAFIVFVLFMFAILGMRH